MEITDAAIEAFARLLVVTGKTFRTYGRNDGGLICEQRSRRPTFWRILADGTLLPDKRYSFSLGTFATVGSGAPVRQAIA